MLRARVKKYIDDLETSQVYFNPDTYPRLKNYLLLVEQKISPGLIGLSLQNILEGWGLQEETPSPEQLAAAIFMEASTQDFCVKEGETVDSYPQTLRLIAHKILRLAGHDVAPSSIVQSHGKRESA